MAAVTLDVMRLMQGPIKTVRQVNILAGTADVIPASTKGYAVLLWAIGTTSTNTASLLDGATAEFSVVPASGSTMVVAGPIVRVDDTSAQTAPLVYVPPGNALRLTVTGGGTWVCDVMYLEVCP